MWLNKCILVLFNFLLEISNNNGIVYVFLKLYIFSIEVFN